MNKLEYRIYLWLLILCVISLIVALFIGIVFDSESQTGPIIVIPKLPPSSTPIVIPALPIEPAMPLTGTKDENPVFYYDTGFTKPTNQPPVVGLTPVVTVTLPFDPDFCICATPEF